MILEADVWFNLIKTVLTTALTLGLMISLTEFRFSGPVVARIHGVYLLYVAASPAPLMRMFGFTSLFFKV